jgi:hypothetical protein
LKILAEVDKKDCSMYGKPRKRNYTGIAISFSLHEASGSRLPVADKVEKHGGKFNVPQV